MIEQPPQPTKIFVERDYLGGGVLIPRYNLCRYICELLEHFGPMTREEITKLTAIPRTTIYDTIIGKSKKIIRIKHGIKVRPGGIAEIDIISDSNRKRGRPYKIYKFVRWL